MNKLVELNNEQVVTTSLVVAESFDKKHKNVIQSIENLTAENPAIKNMFEKSVYTNERNREYPMYYINRDGFTLLAMGFTGKEALTFKLNYIEAFNEMEKLLKKEKLHSYLIEDPIARAEQWIVEQKEKLALEETINEYKPKVDYYNTILNSADTVNITQIAKDYGMSGRRLNQLLNEERVQYKIGGQWMLYQKYADKGYTRTHTHSYDREDGTTGTNIQTKWTQKGRLLIHNILTDKGYVAEMDKEKEAE